MGNCVSKLIGNKREEPRKEGELGPGQAPATSLTHLELQGRMQGEPQIREIQLIKKTDFIQEAFLNITARRENVDSLYDIQGSLIILKGKSKELDKLTNRIEIVDKLFEEITRKQTFESILIELMGQLQSLNKEMERWIDQMEKIDESMIQKFAVLWMFELIAIPLTKKQQQRFKTIQLTERQKTIHQIHSTIIDKVSSLTTSTIQSLFIHALLESKNKVEIAQRRVAWVHEQLDLLTMQIPGWKHAGDHDDVDDFMKKYQSEKAGKIWRENTPRLVSLKEEKNLAAAIEILETLESEVWRCVKEILTSLDKEIKILSQLPEQIR